MTMDIARKDFLTELLNIGVGKAGSVISDMLGSQVLLEVPQVELCSASEITPSLQALNNEKVISVNLPFSGVFSGDAALLLTNFSGKMLVHRMLQNMGDDSDPGELKQEALTEVGNIVVNYLVGSWSEIFPGVYTFGIPEYNFGSLADFVERHVSADRRIEDRICAVSASAHFNVQDFFIMGTLVVFFDDRSVELLLGMANTEV